jgi:hypothetical protein
MQRSAEAEELSLQRDNRRSNEGKGKMAQQ